VASLTSKISSGARPMPTYYDDVGDGWALVPWIEDRDVGVS
jgi:hypothetical protein